MEQRKIKIITIQEADGQTERLKTVARGTLTVTQTAYILEYDWCTQEGTAHTTLTVDKTSPKVVMENTGRMVIEENKEHHSPYRMGPCDFDLGVTGETVLCRLTPKGGNLKLQYTLTINGTFASRNTVELFVE